MDETLKGFVTLKFTLRPFGNCRTPKFLLSFSHIIKTAHSFYSHHLPHFALLNKNAPQTTTTKSVGATVCHRPQCQSGMPAAGTKHQRD